MGAPRPEAEPARARPQAGARDCAEPEEEGGATGWIIGTVFAVMFIVLCLSFLSILSLGIALGIACTSFYVMRRLLPLYAHHPVLCAAAARAFLSADACASHSAFYVAIAFVCTALGLVQLLLCWDVRRFVKAETCRRSRKREYYRPIRRRDIRWPDKNIVGKTETVSGCLEPRPYPFVGSLMNGKYENPYFDRL